MRLGLVIWAGFKLQCRTCVQNRLMYVCSSNPKQYKFIPPFNELVGKVPSFQNLEVTSRLTYSTQSRPSNFNPANDKSSLENAKPDQTKKKKELKVYISLLASDGNFISVTTIEEATKLAKRRNMRLSKEMDYDPKTGRAVYKLVTESEYLKGDTDWGDSKSRKEKGKSTKGDKVVSLTSSTAEHDVLIKVKMMLKWLEKRHEVKVVITGDSKNGENVFKIIEREISINGRIVQKRSKGPDIRFQILPPKKTETPKKIDSSRNTEQQGEETKGVKNGT
ncbi:uncharacterized protein LOC128989713 [Macrosteles quadrilineatus]|uniref:uncharacterized protein LOC128989713 n=1 Tax=Macrosteles quadrilineatus TaxID=74068 RepID=UPI0023E271B2|nr:uncharacterized protein LOC128989713 [Macrosteles quadrilineatus]